MNDRKVKGKPHIEAKQISVIHARGFGKISVGMFYIGNWESTPQGGDFWVAEFLRLTEKGL